MKVGILTFHNGINAGTFMQARGLYRQLVSHGHEVSIIDYTNKHQLRIDRASIWKTRHPIKLFLNIRKSRAYARTLKTLDLSPQVHSAEEINKLGYDAIVFGSDELWNIESTYANGDLVFMGEGISGVRKVAYAPSFGSVTDLGGQQAKIKSLLCDFSALSARDENTHRILEELTAQSIPLVVDPVLLSDPEPFDSKLKLNLSGKIGMYMMNPSAADGERISHFAERMRKPLVSVGYYYRWVDEHLVNLAPYEVPEALAGADIVVTNTFHGVVFALKYHKRFILVDQPTKTTKLDTFCNMFGLTRVLSDEPEVLDTHLNHLPEGDRRMREMIITSREYLTNAL